MVVNSMLKYEVWSWEKNKKFELALLEVNEDEPDRWDKIATIVGEKSATEVEEHYKELVQDLNLIESSVSIEDLDDLVEFQSQSFQKLATATAPLGLSLNVQNSASLLQFLTLLNGD